jgi:hypothetical protein
MSSAAFRQIRRLDFIARLAALVPKPRVNLTRFHGVFAPNSRYRARVTPAKWGRESQHCSTRDSQEPMPGERRASMAGFCSCKTGIHAIHGNNVVAHAHPCASRHLDILTNGRSA